MRKTTLFILMALLFALPTFAQHNKGNKNRQEMRKEVLEFKLKFLAQEMDLTDDQQKPFVDTYTQMQKERGRIFRETKALERKLKESEEVSDAEYESVAKAITAAKGQDAAIERKYDQRFAQFLTPKQIFKMKSAEEHFRQKMHEMRGNRGNHSRKSK